MVDTYITVRVATAAAIINYTNNGQTMQSTVNAVLTVDGIAVVVNDWILVKDQVADTTHNGLYQMTQLGIAGGGGQPWIIKRQGLGLMLKHDMVFQIIAGTANAGKLIRLVTADLITPGATALPGADFVEMVLNLLGDLTGDIYAANDTSKILENGTDGTNAWLQGDINANNGTEVFENGTDGTNAWTKADIQANNGTVVVSNGTDGTDAWAKTDVQANNGTVVLYNGTDGTDAWAKGDIQANNGTVVVSNGTDGTDAWIQGDVKANNGATVLVHGATGVASSYVGTINSVNNITQVNVGAVGSGAIVATENGDAYHHRTILTITNLVYAGKPAGAANEGFGALLYTLTGANVIINACYMSVALTCTGTVTADTPDVGIGTTVASGAIAVLSANPLFENVLTGQTAADVNGTATVKLLSTILDIPVANNHTIYLNMADGWAGADTITANGTVILDYMIM